MERLNKEGLKYYTSLIQGLIHQGSGNVARITEQQIQDLFGEAKVYEIRYWTVNNQELNLEENVELPNGWVHHGWCSEGYGLVTSTVPIEAFLNVFTQKSDLTQISLPVGVASIGNGAFAGCFSLTSITIPNSVTSIGSDAFYDCSSLYCITVGETPYYSDSDGDLTVTLSNGITYTFSGCSQGVECVLPGTQILTSLEGATKSVEELNIGDQVVTYNNGEMIEAPIDKVINVVHNDYITLTLENDMTLSLSTDHAIKTMNGWKAYNPAITEVPDNVGTLTVDDHVLTNNGYIKINNIEYVNKPNTTMYNIGIKDHNDYFANGICVYECSGSN